MAKIPNWSANEDMEGSRIDVPGTREKQPVKFAWLHDFLPKQEVLVVQRTDKSPTTYQIWHEGRGRKPTDKHTLLEKGIKKQNSARNKATNWMEKNPLPGLNPSPETVVEEWDRQLERMANMENARIHANIGDQEANDGVEKKVAKFGDFVAVAEQGDVGGEIVSDSGEMPDVQMPEISGKGGRVPSAEAEVQTLMVAEQVAKELGMDKSATEAIMNIVEKEKGRDLGQVTYWATSGRVRYYGDPGLDSIEFPRKVNGFKKREHSDSFVRYAGKAERNGNKFWVEISVNDFDTDGVYVINGEIHQSDGNAETDFRPIPETGGIRDAKQAKSKLLDSLQVMSPESYLDDAWDQLKDHKNVNKNPDSLEKGQIAFHTRGGEDYQVEVLEVDESKGDVRIRLKENAPFANKGDSSWVDMNEVSIP